MWKLERAGERENVRDEEVRKKVRCSERVGVGMRQGHVEELTCRKKNQGEDRPSDQALISLLGNISLAFKTRHAVVVEILSLHTAAKTKL